MVNRVTRLLRLLLVLMSLVLMGCNNTSAIAPLLSPTAIIVRNHSGIDFASASLASLPEDTQAARSYGELAPIPNRIEQVYGRPSRAAPLPNVVEFRLRSMQGNVISQKCRLDELAQQAADFTTPYALVFELQSGGVIRFLLEASR